MIIPKLLDITATGCRRSAGEELVDVGDGLSGERAGELVVETT